MTSTLNPSKSVSFLGMLLSFWFFGHPSLHATTIPSLEGPPYVLGEMNTTFSVAHDGVFFSVAEANPGDVTASCTVELGTLHVDLSGSATITAGANDSTTLSVSGSITDVDATLTTLNYTPNEGKWGGDLLTMALLDSVFTVPFPGFNVNEVGINVINPDHPIPDNALFSYNVSLTNSTYGALTIHETVTLDMLLGGSPAALVFHHWDLQQTADIASMEGYNKLQWKFDDETLRSSEVNHFTEHWYQRSIDAPDPFDDLSNGQSSLLSFVHSTVSGTEQTFTVPAQVILTKVSTASGWDQDFTGAFDGSFIVVRNDSPNNGLTEVYNVSLASSGPTIGGVAAVSGDEDAEIAISESDAYLTVEKGDVDDLTVSLAATDGTLNVTLSGAASFTAGDNDEASFSINGTETDLNAALATLSYQGDAHYNGSDTLTYSVSDGTETTADATVAITVNAVNDAPTIGGISAVSGDEDTPISITGEEDYLEVADPDGDTLTVTLTATNGTLNVTLSDTTITAGANDSASMSIQGSIADLTATLPTLSFTGDADYHGAATLTYTVSDGTETTADATIDITVNPVNDGGPVLASIGNQTGIVDTPFTITLSATDVDGDDIAFTATSSDNITTSVDGDELTFTPDAGFEGTEAITITADDGNGGTSDETVNVSFADGPSISAPAAISGDEDTGIPIAVEPSLATLAGSGVSGYVDDTGETAQFSFPKGVVMDSNGDFFVADLNNNRIRKVTADGTVSTFAGDGSTGHQDGTGTAAAIYTPWGIEIDSSDNLYVALHFGKTVRKITPAGEVTTLAGVGGSSGDATGAAADTRFNKPTSLALDEANNLLYVGDSGNNKIYKIDLGVAGSEANFVTELAGDGSDGFQDGTGASAQFNWPYGMDVDSAGNLYVADTLNYRIRKVSPAGEVATIAGDGTSQVLDGTGTAARFRGPADVLVVDDSTLFVADGDGHYLRMVELDNGNEVSILPSGGAHNQVTSPNGLYVDGGLVYVAADSHTLQVVTLDAGVVAEKSAIDNLTTTLSVENGTLNVTLSGAATISAGANDSATLTISGNEVDTNATLASLTYQGDADFSGSDTLTYSVADTALGTAEATVSITVNNVNDDPVLSIGNQSTDEDVPLELDLATLATDPDASDTLAYFSDGSTHLAASFEGTTLKLIPATDWFGTESVTVTVDDGNGGTDETTFNLTVNAVNDAPEIILASSSILTQGPGYFGNWSGQEYYNSVAFAALKLDGSVVTWGTALSGGDSSGVSAELGSGVVSIFSTDRAFAALKSDGSVVTWGSHRHGGNSSSVSAGLGSGVVSIFSTEQAFAALKSDGSVVTWGNPGYGGNSSSVSAGLGSGVVSIFSAERAFAALKSDGSVVTWGLAPTGGNSSSVSDGLGSGVVSISSSQQAFAALKSDGSVVTWGSPISGGNSSSVSAGLVSGVVSISSTERAFAALKTDGSVVTWGGSQGGDSSGVSAGLESGVVSISPSTSAFAALKSDGSVVTWGGTGSDSSGVSAGLESGVISIFTGSRAFAALKSDGSVVTWGTAGGDSSAVSTGLESGVVSISSSMSSFAALKSDGSVVTWGGTGGDSSGVSDELGSEVVSISSTKSAFAALKADGSVVTWGNSSTGGDSSGIPALSDVATIHDARRWTLVTLDPTVDEEAVLPLSINVTDVEGGTLTVNLSVSNGTLSATASGDGPASVTNDGTATLSIEGGVDDLNATLATLTYTGNTDFAGAETLTYTVSDGTDSTDPATASITVNNVNDAPVLDPVGDQQGVQNTEIEVNLSSSDVDEGDTVTYTATNSENITSSVDGTTLTWTSEPGYLGTETIIITATDGSGATDTETISVTFMPPNVAPVVSGPETASGDEESSISLAANDEEIVVGDEDGDDLTVSLSVSNGTLSLDIGGGATIASGENNSPSVSITGSIPQVNAALLTLDYTGDDDFFGEDTLALSD